MANEVRTPCPISDLATVITIELSGLIRTKTLGSIGPAAGADPALGLHPGSEMVSTKPPPTAATLRKSRRVKAVIGHLQT